jgi:hypothetical protein
VDLAAMSNENPIIEVRQDVAVHLSRGDVVWAPDDSDWLKVHKARYDEDADEVTVYRADGSEATFRASREVLVRVAPPGPPNPPKPPTHRPVG